jgi:hypothetical protein
MFKMSLNFPDYFKFQLKYFLIYLLANFDKKRSYGYSINNNLQRYSVFLIRKINLSSNYKITHYIRYIHTWLYNLANYYLQYTNFFLL